MNEVSFQFHLYLLFDNSYNVDSITKKLQLTPSKTWVLDPANPKPLYSKFSGWRVTSEKMTGFVFEELFADFYSTIESRLDVIKEIVDHNYARAKLDVVVIIDGGDTMPGISLSPAHMQTLSAIKCGIDFDLYDNR